MLVKDLIKKLVQCPMDAVVEIEVRTDQYSSFSSASDIDVSWYSDKNVVISEVYR